MFFSYNLEFITSKKSIFAPNSRENKMINIAFENSIKISYNL